MTYFRKRIKTVKFWSALKFAEKINNLKFLHLYRFGHYHNCDPWSQIPQNRGIISYSVIFS